MERYRVARSALHKIDPAGAWTKRFQVLDDEHAVPLPSGLGDGTAKITWIWKLPKCDGFKLSIVESNGGSSVTVREAQEATNGTADASVGDGALICQWFLA